MLNTQWESGWLPTETLYKMKSSQALCPKAAAFAWASHQWCGFGKVQCVGNGWFERSFTASTHLWWWCDTAPMWCQKGCWVTLFPVSLVHEELALEHCLFTACRETEDKEDNWQPKEPMGDTRTMSASTHFPVRSCLILDQTDRSTTLIIHMDSPGEHNNLETLKFGVCSQNSRNQWEAETFYNLGPPDSWSLFSQWKKTVVVE